MSLVLLLDRVVNPIFLILVIAAITSFLFVGLFFAGKLSDWKQTAPPRFRRISAVLAVVYGLLNALVLRMHVPPQPLITHPSPPRWIPMVVVTTPFDPTLLFAPVLSYPAVAQRERKQGTVLLELAVNAEGKVAAVNILEGDTMLAIAAQGIVFQYRYQPALSARIRPIIKRIGFDFSLVPTQAPASH